MGGEKVAVAGEGEGEGERGVGKPFKDKLQVEESIDHKNMES